MSIKSFFMRLLGQGQGKKKRELGGYIYMVVSTKDGSWKLYKYKQRRNTSTWGRDVEVTEYRVRNLERSHALYEILRKTYNVQDALFEVIIRDIIDSYADL